MKATSWFAAFDESRGADEVISRLRRERLLQDPRNPRDVVWLRKDVERLVADMNDVSRPPPMLWSGIPNPPTDSNPTCDSHLVISVGGTNTVFAIMRLQEGVLQAFDPTSGEFVTGADELNRLRNAGTIPTPVHSAALSSGFDMIRIIVERIVGHLPKSALASSAGILLSWGFAHRKVRTGSTLLGGLSGRVLGMSKAQAGFSSELIHRDLGELFGREFERQIGWKCPLAVANDTVMALHYFLAPEWRSRTHRQGLFINGTGSNFATSEPYAVRAQGFLSTPDEVYQPVPVTSDRPLDSDETLTYFFVNYESGSSLMGETATRFDDEEDYPIERNTLAGGRAYPKQFKNFVSEFLSRDIYARLEDTLSESPGAREVGLLSGADGSPSAVAAVFPGLTSGEAEAAGIWLIARAVVNRSALHAGIILAAATRRNGFGLGGDEKPDLMCMEGSVWRVPHYPKLVEDWWQALIDDTLKVEFAAEPSYNASLPGPLYLAALHS